MDTMEMDRNKEKKFEKREALINIAMNEFGEKGYENASLNNILSKTGISKGTFYYHYKNKEDLYMQLLDIIIEEKLKFMNKEVNISEENHGIFHKLQFLIEAGMKFSQTNPTIDKFAQSFIKETSTEAYEERMQRYFLSRKEFLEDILEINGFKSIDYIGDLLEEGISNGEIREDLPKEFIKKVMNYTFSNLRVLADAENLEEYEVAARYLLEILKNGIDKKNEEI